MEVVQPNIIICCDYTDGCGGVRDASVPPFSLFNQCSLNSDTSCGLETVCDDGVDNDCLGGDLDCSCSCIDSDGDGNYPTSCTDTLCFPRDDCNDGDANAPIVNLCASLGYNCGSWDDGCGNFIDCGSCSADYYCNAGFCVYSSGGSSGGGDDLKQRAPCLGHVDPYSGDWICD